MKEMSKKGSRGKGRREKKSKPGLQSREKSTKISFKTNSGFLWEDLDLILADSNGRKKHSFIRRCLYVYS